MGIARLGFLTSIKNRLTAAGQETAPTLAQSSPAASSWDSLIQRYQTTGDNRALEALYDEHANRLYYYLLVMSDPNTAADVTQKVWLKLVESPQLYKAQGQFQAWLFTVGHRMLIDEIRRDKRWTYDDDVDALPDEHQELRHCDDFHQALKQLPFAQREAFSLQQEDFSLQDIATICNVPVETVKTRLRYARDNLRKLWKPSA